jgi:NADH-quinone oxidoreductase subunit N
MVVMASARDLVTIFVALELLSIPAYLMATWRKRDLRSNEAGLKYYLMGVFASAVLLYGMSLLYGAAGSTMLVDIDAAISTDGAPPAVVTLGVIFAVVGFGFKVSAFPFHTWAPDTYEGAPTPVTAFLSVGSKAASFAMLLRIFVEGMGALTPDWQVIFAFLAVVTMTVGNIAAITQSNMKRMLAYSSIAHAGYILIGVVAATERGVVAALVYLWVYLFMQIGAFAVVTMLRRSDVVGDELKDLSGLFTRAPVAAVAMLLFMLSLGGIPPTAGFMGKVWVFGAAIDQGFIWLAVVGVINSAISLYYYLRVVVFMFFKEAASGSEITIGPAMAATLTVTVVGTILFGIYPQMLFEQAQAVAGSLGASVTSAALQ